MEQGDLNNPYSNSDCYKSCPFSHFQDSRGQNGHLLLLLSLRRILTVNMKFVIVGWPADFFFGAWKEQNMPTMPQKQTALSKALGCVLGSSVLSW